MLGNFGFATAWRLKVLDQIWNLLLGQFRLGNKFYTASDLLDAAFHRPFLDQLPLELADRGKNVELKPGFFDMFLLTRL